MSGYGHRQVKCHPNKNSRDVPLQARYLDHPKLWIDAGNGYIHLAWIWCVVKVRRGVGQGRGTKRGHTFREPKDRARGGVFNIGHSFWWQCRYIFGVNWRELIGGQISVDRDGKFSFKCHFSLNKVN